MEGEIKLDSHSKSLIHKMNLKVQTAVTVKKTLPKGLLARQCKFLGQKSLAKLLKDTYSKYLHFISYAMKNRSVLLLSSFLHFKLETYI